MGHGVTTRQVVTSLSTPVTAASGITFAVGTAPAHTAGGSVNDPVLCYSYDEAVTAFGYSDDWTKYPLCEVMYTQFKLYGVAPLVLVNVFDMETHKKSADEAPKAYPLTDKKILLPLEAVAATVKAEGYKVGEDYELFYSGEHLVLEVVDGGGIPAETGELTLTFRLCDPGAVAASDIIGGFDTNSKKYMGLELLDQVFPKYNVVPDLIIAPGWSQNAGVAAVMAAKAEKINDIFRGKALIDIPADQVRHYADVPAWKKKNGVNAASQILCWPMVRMAGDDEDHPRLFHLSTHAAARMGRTDTENGGCPSESPSNKALQTDGAVLADGTPVLLDTAKANYLNDNGVVTALNFIGGYVLWGNSTACFPASTDVKDYFISVSRMFGWVSNSLILTYWTQVDKKMTRRFIASILDSVNIWMNGLVAQGHLLGGRVEFRDEENTEVALMAGKATFHLFLTPPSPAQEIEFVLEYAVEYVKSALSG